MSQSHTSSQASAISTTITSTGRKTATRLSPTDVPSSTVDATGAPNPSVPALMAGRAAVLPVWTSPVRNVSLRGDVADPDLTALMAGGWPSLERIEEYVAKKGVPAYGVRLQLYGPRQTIEGTWEYAQRKLKALVPGATFEVLAREDMPPSQELIEKLGHHYFGISE